MSNSGRVFPSFGVSKSKHNHHHNSTAQPGIQNLSHALLIQQQQQQQQQPANSGAPNQSQSGTKARVVNVSHQQSGTPGEMCLNTEDNLIYYYNGRKWVPLAINNDQEFHVENGNINIVAHTVPGKSGGNITITSGMGGFADGVINLNIGRENAIVIDEKQVVIHDRELVLKRGERTITLPIEPAISPLQLEQPLVPEKKKSTPERFELSDDTTVVKTVSGKGVVQVSRAIGNEVFYFEMENDMIEVSSWIHLTAGCDEQGAVPYAFVKSMKSGRCEIGIKALEGDLTKVTVYYHLV